MTKTIQTRPDIFQSYEKLESSLICKNSIAKIVKNKILPERKLIPFIPDEIGKKMLVNGAPKHLLNRWRCVEYSTAPFRLLIFFVLSIIGIPFEIAREFQLFNRIGATSICEKIQNANSWLADCVALRMLAPKTQCYRISYALNRPHFKARYITKWQDISHDQIPDPKVIKRLFDKSAHFDHKLGICRGMSYCCLKYYLDTQGQFSSERAQMAAIGKLFRKGGREEAVLVQSIHIRKGKILNLSFDWSRNYFNQSNDLTQCFQNPTWKFWKENRSQILVGLQEIPPGAYHLGIPRHGMSYIKISSQQAFLFDPNDGIIEINGPDQAEYLYALLNGKIQSIKKGLNSSIDNEILYLMRAESRIPRN